MKNRIKFSARVIIALAVVGLGVILAACADSSNSISGALATPTVDSGPAATATAVERLIEEMVAATVMELRIQTMVAVEVATIKAGFTLTPTPTATAVSTQTSTPISSPTPSFTPPSKDLARPTKPLVIGINADLREFGGQPHDPTVEELVELLPVGSAVRLVAHKHRLDRLPEQLTALKNRGWVVYLIVNQETTGVVAGESWSAYASRYIGVLKEILVRSGSFIDFLEIWNEPGHPGPGWNNAANGWLGGNHLSAEEYGELLMAAYQVVKESQPRIQVLAAAGEYNWKLKELSPRPFDAVSLHIYGQKIDGWPEKGDGGEIRDVVLAVHQFLGVPVYVTEFGLKRSEHSAEDQGKFLRECSTVFHQLGPEVVPCAIWYSWGTSEYGLVENGQRLPAWEAFAELVSR